MRTGLRVLVALAITGQGATGGRATGTILAQSPGYPPSEAGDRPSAAFFAQKGFTHTIVGSTMPWVPYSFLTAEQGNPYAHGSAAEAWRQEGARKLAGDISGIKTAGLEVWSGTDIFVLPQSIFNASRDKFTAGSPDGKRIALNNFTLSVLASAIDEAFELFPGLDGLVVRVGENYGGPSGPVAWEGQGAVNFRLSKIEQQAEYAKFITALRETVCVKHGKRVIFRTWDTSGFGPKYTAGFHPSLEYYLNVTSAVEPHPSLIFSIKHVALDFWRWVGFNPSLTKGVHKQIVEVECAREYEGKGAMSNYIGSGVIDGWPEFDTSDSQRGKGLAQIVQHPLIVGLWMWSSGGGWNGPRVGNHTLWPMTNTLVLATWWLNSTLTPAPALPTSSPITEAAAFAQHCLTTLVRSSSPTAVRDCETVHQVAVLSQTAILQTRYCSPYDSSLQTPGDGATGVCGTVSCMPTNNWLRDDRLGGLALLGGPEGFYGNPGAIYWLHKTDAAAGSALSAAAIVEKDAAVDTWGAILNLSQSVTSGPPEFRTELVTTAMYGLLLAEVVRYGWTALILGYGCTHSLSTDPERSRHNPRDPLSDVRGSGCNVTALREAIKGFDAAEVRYNATLKTLPSAATPFIDGYEAGEVGGKDVWTPGLGASVNTFRNLTLSRHE